MTERHLDKSRFIWGSLTQIQTIGSMRLARLRRFFKNPEDVFTASQRALLQAGLEERVANIFLEKRKLINISRLSEILKNEDIRVLLPEDPDYPALLREIPDLPQVLFVRGNLASIRSPLAVVGTRKMSAYGARITAELLGPLVRSGVSIVSGLALGIDAIAHRAALDNHGHTVAVLGSGCDDMSIYPASNLGLARDILASDGAIISEFPPKTESFKSHFPIRNRIIAGMTLGTLVTEADINSGSLITARAALDYNRDVFAVPGDIYSQTSMGTNNLLKLGARLVTEPSDIASYLGINMDTKPAPLPLPEGPDEAALILALSREPRHIDELVRKSCLDISAVSATLTILEMKGAVRNVGNMHYVLSR